MASVTLILFPSTTPFRPRELAYEGHTLADSLITSHRHKLDELATALLDREALDRADLDRILGDARRLRVAAMSGD
jgi:hypothetical protein